MAQEEAITRATGFGISEATARAVVAAYDKAAALSGRAFDPGTWSNTIWEAEAQRYERARDPEAHLTLILHVQRLREQWEEMARRRTRGWEKGPVGERLTKR